MEVVAGGEPPVGLAAACPAGSGGFVEGPGGATGRQVEGHAVSEVAALSAVREDAVAR